MCNMNICNTCGASLINRDGRWVCPACGTYAPEEITNEELTLLYNANMLLRTLDFDGAENAFTDLIERYPKNSAGIGGDSVLDLVSNMSVIIMKEIFLHATRKLIVC